MTRYRVLINQQNFLLSVDGQPKRMGFYVTHLVDAAGCQEAGIAAINPIKQDSNLYDITLNQENDPPILDVDEIEEANSLDVSTGFGFYPEDESG